MLKQRFSKRTIHLLVLIGIALLSSLVISRIATSPFVHAKTMEYLDEKKMDTMGMTTITAAASVVISLIPGDATTPIANQIAELSTYLLIVVCAIFLEKYLLTVTGYITFVILVPASCLLFGIYLFKKKEVLKVLAIKLLLFGLAIVMIIPISVQVSRLIDDAFDSEKIVEEAIDSGEELEQGVILKVGEKVYKFIEHMIDGVAVLIVTSCVIPVSVFLFFLWIVKILFGITIKVPRLKGKVYKWKNNHKKVDIQEYQNIE